MQIGFFSLLFLILLTLKICGVITISWFWLFTILFSPLILFGAIFAIIFLIAAITK